MNIDEALEYAQNALERAFEDWLETKRPSGDCESVHRQWDNSYARLELVDELQPVMVLTTEVRRLRHQWAYYQDFCKQNGFDGITAMAVAVDKLREENERLRENAKIIYELEQLAARSNNELLVENERLRKDAERIDWISNEFAHLEPFDMPTGDDDCEIGWRVMQSHCGELTPRVIAESFNESVRDAIDAARGAK